MKALKMTMAVLCRAEPHWIHRHPLFTPSQPTRLWHLNSFGRFNVTLFFWTTMMCLINILKQLSLRCLMALKMMEREMLPWDKTNNNYDFHRCPQISLNILHKYPLILNGHDNDGEREICGLGIGQTTIMISIDVLKYN